MNPNKKIEDDLRRLAMSMELMGEEMEYYGGFDQLGQNGIELIEMSRKIKEWADELETPINASEKTDWYPPDTHPVRGGWYDRNYSGLFGGIEDHCKKIWKDIWAPEPDPESPLYPGVWYVIEEDGRLNDACYAELPWRGLKRAE